MLAQDCILFSHYYHRKVIASDMTIAQWQKMSTVGLLNITFCQSSCFSQTPKNIFNHRPVVENKYSDADSLWCIKFLSQNHGQQSEEIQVSTTILSVKKDQKSLLIQTEIPKTNRSVYFLFTFNTKDQSSCFSQTPKYTVKIQPITFL